MVDAFECLVEDAVHQLQGMVWGWLGDGGLGAFYRNNSTDRARHSFRVARSILTSIRDFNEEFPLPLRNQVGGSIEWF